MPIKVEDSWRMVEGDNDSFDTSILPSADSADDILLPLSSENPSSGLPSQLSSHSQSQSQSQSQGASQDSIRDFVKHQEDEQVILRQPFRPSVASASLTPRDTSYRTPDPEFRMPVIDAAGDRRSSGRSSLTARPDALRRRPLPAATESSVKRGGRRRSAASAQKELDEGPSTMNHISNWALSVIGLAFRYAKRPLALLLAIYVSCGAIIMTQNMLHRSISASLSPLCRIPGASLLNLPFCPSSIPNPDSKATVPIEFEDLVGAQSKFEDVLEKSADGVSLPFEMKRSESSLRDLRTLVRHSSIQSRDELVLEFDGYIDTARETTNSLSKFNSHVGSAVDSVISINRWTSRYIASLQDSPSSSSSDPNSVSIASSVSHWLFYPFQPTDNSLRELILRDKYIEHTALVSERISSLILEAQAVLRLLSKAEDHLSLIYDISSRSSASISSHRSQVFYSIWTLVGAHTGKLRSLSQQLSLLKQVDSQRSSAVSQVTALVVELEGIQATLGDLRDRVAEPELVRDSPESAAQLPLSVHIETIDLGIQRLEAARSRIQSFEDDRVREALAKGGIRDAPERLLEAQKN